MNVPTMQSVQGQSLDGGYSWAVAAIDSSYGPALDFAKIAVVSVMRIVSYFGHALIQF